MALKLVTSVELFCCLVSWLVFIRLGLADRVVRGCSGLSGVVRAGSSHICRSCRAAVGIVNAELQDDIRPSGTARLSLCLCPPLSLSLHI